MDLEGLSCLSSLEFSTCRLQVEGRGSSDVFLLCLRGVCDCCRGLADSA